VKNIFLSGTSEVVPATKHTSSFLDCFSFWQFDG